MTFEEWKQYNRLIIVENNGVLDTWGLMELAWNAATAAEREGCAKVCDVVDSQYVAYKSNAKECASRIRERSNEVQP